MNGQESTTGAFAGPLVAPFIAVSAVTAIMTALFVWLGSGDPTPDAATVGQSTSTSAPAATPTPPASSPPASSPPASTPAPSTSAPEPSETADPDRPAVVVLNQSGPSGLGGRVAGRVRQAGWKVFKTGNFNGTVSTTTVYYPSGLRKPAEELAKDLPGDPRVLERFSNLSETRLTIVLTDDYGS